MSRFSTEPLNFVCSRRELPGKLFAIAGALLLPERRSEVLVTPTKVQPKFKIGDLVAYDWKDEEDDDVPHSGTEFGQILGMRWVLEDEYCFPLNTWVYYVCWTHGSDSTFYPCYDGEPTGACDLRLVSAAEGICKR